MDVLQRANENGSSLDVIRRWKYSWLGHVLRHDGLPKNRTDDKMTGKPAKGRKSLNTLSDLSEKGNYMALKRRIDNRKEWQKLKTAVSHTPASQQIT